MRKRILTGLAFAVLMYGLVANANAALLTGAINGLPESGDTYYWGDGVNNLFQEWSMNTMNPEGDGINYGWFYTSEYLTSNADVYVYSGLEDISTITDASTFSYTTTGAILAGEGDTVFFRGLNGYFGAWKIEDIYLTPDATSTLLTAQWYFQDDRTGNFSGTSTPTPEPTTMLLFGTGLVGLIGRRIRTKVKK